MLKFHSGVSVSKRRRSAEKALSFKWNVGGLRWPTKDQHSSRRGQRKTFWCCDRKSFTGSPSGNGKWQAETRAAQYLVCRSTQTNREWGQKTVNCSLWKKDDNEYFCTLLGHKKETHSVLILKMPELYLYAFISNEKVYLTEHARCSKTKGTFLFGHLLCLSCSDGENVGLPIEKKPQSFTSSLGFFSLSLCSLKMRAAHS